MEIVIPTRGGRCFVYGEDPIPYVMSQIAAIAREMGVEVEELDDGELNMRFSDSDERDDLVRHLRRTVTDTPSGEPIYYERF